MFYIAEPYLKQVPKRDPVKIEAHNPSNIITKDSEAQPPNPVPPESNSDEVKNIDTSNYGKVNNEKLLNDVLLAEKVKEDEAADKLSETHPKNLKGKLDEAKLTNGNSENKAAEKPDIKANEEIKDEKLKLKQQQLIETMKQHGEEQKDLMQEQKEIIAEIIKNKDEQNKNEPSAESKVEANIPKENKEQQLLEAIKQHGEEHKEILNEIIKSKKEFEQNKEVNSNEAKKIAVESIKQIAKMAIKSIGGVSEKPVAQDVDIKAERLEKLTNEAVQQIAKKAVETIEAIKDIKENPDSIVKAKVAENKENLEVLQAIEQIMNQNPEAPKASPQQVVDYVNKPNKVKTNEKTLPETGENNVENPQNVKKHSHSPDEPQSYKKGENAQVNDKLNENLPLPLASLQTHAKEGLQHSQDKELNIDFKNTIQRQKREIVSTKTISLDSADRKLIDCKSLISPESDILPKVDLNDVLSIINPAHHIGRSLKNYDGNEKDRNKK